MPKPPNRNANKTESRSSRYAAGLFLILAAFGCENEVDLTEAIQVKRGAVVSALKPIPKASHELPRDQVEIIDTQIKQGYQQLTGLEQKLIIQRELIKVTIVSHKVEEGEDIERLVDLMADGYFFLDYSTYGRIGLKKPNKEGFDEFQFNPSYPVPSMKSTLSEEEKAHEEHLESLRVRLQDRYLEILASEKNRSVGNIEKYDPEYLMAESRNLQLDHYFQGIVTKIIDVKMAISSTHSKVEKSRLAREFLEEMSQMRVDLNGEEVSALKSSDALMRFLTNQDEAYEDFKEGLRSYIKK
ncbi:hypothetical protein KAR91_63535 [Candidatus Pacearchaeota archaeon]|nr:hypothetical protein [Candidatus Pacearchaeota archaeon]